MIKKIKKPEVIFFLLLIIILACQTVAGFIGDFMQELSAQIIPPKKVWLVDVEDGGQESCLEGETYHPENGLCYLDNGAAEQPFLAMMANERSYGRGLFDDSFAGDAYNNVYVLVEYEVDGNEIVSPRKKKVRKDLLDEQENTVLQQEIWDLFAAMIPIENREYLTHYIVMTDGTDGFTALVEPNPNHSIKWMLNVDITGAENNIEALSSTLIHEYGHLLTLDFRQVAPYIDDIACTTYYFGRSGCAKSSSYLYHFYDTFWHDRYDDWNTPQHFQDDEAYAKKWKRFYSNHAADFVTEYAATHPVEDIAESWTFFITRPKPTGNTIAEQKILFFYQFPELVELRSEIIARTYSRLIRMP